MKSRMDHIPSGLTFLAAMLLSTSVLHADILTWSGGDVDDDNWSSPDNWGGAVPSNDGADTVRFNEQLAGFQAPIVDLLNPWHVERVDFFSSTANNAVSYTLSGNQLWIDTRLHVDGNLNGDVSVLNDLVFGTDDTANQLFAGTSRTLTLGGTVTSLGSGIVLATQSGGTIAAGAGSLFQTDITVDRFQAATGVTTFRLDHNTAIMDSATVRLQVSSGTGSTRLALNFSGNEIVAGLYLGGVEQAPGTYNATTHASWFTGTGNLLVVPEPSSLLLLSFGWVAILRFRTKHGACR